MLLAVGVAAYSFVQKDSTPAEVETPGPAAAPVKEAASPGEGVGLYETLKTDFAEVDFVFVVLPGLEEGAAATVQTPVTKATEKLVKAGRSADKLILEPGGRAHAEAVNSFAVEQFPAVVAFKKGCQARVVMGAITEDSLLQAYARASASGCGPSGCE